MASYTKSTKTAEFLAVSTVETTPEETNIKVLSGPAVDAPTMFNDKVSSSNGKKMNKMDKKKTKKKRCLFLCCSNMEFEDEEEKDKTLAFLTSENRKLAMVMCCSNFQVGSNDEIEPKKINAK